MTTSDFDLLGEAEARRLYEEASRLYDSGPILSGFVSATPGLDEAIGTLEARANRLILEDAKAHPEGDCFDRIYALPAPEALRALVAHDTSMRHSGHAEGSAGLEYILTHRLADVWHPEGGSA